MGRIKKEDSKIKSITVKVDGLTKIKWDALRPKKGKIKELRDLVFKMVESYPY